MEANKRLCKQCRVLVDRILDGKFGNGRDKRWVNSIGKLWNGSLCPECNIQRAKESMRKLRGKVPA
jgi:hypothetical protein